MYIHTQVYCIFIALLYLTMVRIWIGNELQTITQSEVNNCFYTGGVVSHPSSSVAVSMCDGQMVINVLDTNTCNFSF